MNLPARDFRMPRYDELPNVGLYLEQTVKYINECLSPLNIPVTSSMISNYVKKGYIDRPLKKQYYADQIAYAIFLVLVKQVLAMEHIASLIDMQKKSYPLPIAYNYFCMELEKKLIILFEDRDESPLHTDGVSFEKKVLYRVTSAVAQVIYLNDLFLASDTAS